MYDPETYMILPRYQRVLYIEVAWARCEGNATSVTSRGAAEAANVRPNPIKKLAPLVLSSNQRFKVW